jgi:hypothetical protein
MYRSKKSWKHEASPDGMEGLILRTAGATGRKAPVMWRRAYMIHITSATASRRAAWIPLCSLFPTSETQNPSATCGHTPIKLQILSRCDSALTEESRRHPTPLSRLWWTGCLIYCVMLGGDSSMEHRQEFHEARLFNMFLNHTSIQSLDRVQYCWGAHSLDHSKVDHVNDRR